MEKTASTPIQLFRGMTADELAALRAAHCIRVQRYDKNALIYLRAVWCMRSALCKAAA